MNFPIELYKDEDGVVTQFDNPIIKQKKYYLEATFPDTNNIDHYVKNIMGKTINTTKKDDFSLNYIEFGTNEKLPFADIITYLNTIIKTQ